jgi:hypothetical protein
MTKYPPHVYVIPEDDADRQLADGFDLQCYLDTETLWTHAQLKHNDPDRQRMVTTVKPILFGP